MNVNNLLRRLLTDLKSRFELVREVPKSARRLSWELPRFLELASKKGKVLIVIDGLHRLLTNDNQEASLAWLPMRFPSNVRFIITVTIKPDLRKLDHKKKDHDDDEKKESKKKKSRILAEVVRRNVPFITMKCLDKSVCRTVVETFMQKAVISDSALLATGPYIWPYLQDSNSNAFAKPMQSDVEDSISGFLLFENQMTALLEHPQGGTPLFLRLFLRCTQYAVSRGYCLWHIFDAWLEAQSVDELLHCILDTFEDGRNVNPTLIQESCDRTIVSGGLAALQAFLTWHPNLQKISLDKIEKKKSLTKTALLRGTAQAKLSRRDSSVMTPEDVGGITSEMAEDIRAADLKQLHDSTASGNGNDTKNSISQLIRQNLVDQQMNAVAQDAEQKLSIALLDSMKMINTSISKATRTTATKNADDLLSSIIGNIKRVQSENNGASTTPPNPPHSHSP